MPHIEAGPALVRTAIADELEPIEVAREHGIELTRMTSDVLQDAAGYVCTKRDFESANGDDEDEEEEEEEEKKKEKDEEDEDDDDDDDGAQSTLVREGSTPDAS